MTRRWFLKKLAAAAVVASVAAEHLISAPPGPRKLKTSYDLEGEIDLPRTLIDDLGRSWQHKLEEDIMFGRY